MSNDKSLQQTLQTLKANSQSHFRIMADRLAEHITASGLPQKALKAGDMIPSFALPTADGAFVTSDELLARGPLVLTFYRGHWCPYCMATLGALEASVQAIADAGGVLVAVTPEAHGWPQQLKDSLGLSYEILNDLDHGLALQFGLVFWLPDDQHADYSKSDVDLARINGNGGWFLPLPATYVIAQDGRIVRAFIPADYRERMEPEDAVPILLSLRKGA